MSAARTPGPLVIVFTLLDEETREVEHRLPARYAVCDRCRGRGVHDHPAFAKGITGEEWNGPDWDDDSREAYMAGAYGVPCEVCKGERVVLEADEEAFTAEQRAAWEAWQADVREAAACDASERHLRFMESGGRF